MLTGMDIEELSVNLSSDDPAIGLRASLALHRLAERVEANHVRVGPGKRAGRGSRSETLWASPANRAHQIQQGVIMTPNPLCQRRFTPGPSICGPMRRPVAEVIAELAPITSCRLVGGSLDRSRVGREPAASSSGP